MNVTIKPILVEENRFLFIRYVDANEDEATIYTDIDFSNIL